MKKTFLKLLSVLLIFTLIFSVSSIGASAANSGYVLSFDSNGGKEPLRQWKGKKYYEIHSVMFPEKEGYIFLGWSTDKNATKSDYLKGDYITLTEDTTLYAVWAPLPTVWFVNKPEVNTVLNYGDRLIITAETSELPDGIELRWKSMSIKTYGNGNTCKVTATKNDSTISVEAWLEYSKNGEPVKYDGHLIGDEQYVEFNFSIWAKIAYFFKWLFGIDTTIYQ